MNGFSSKLAGRIRADLPWICASLVFSAACLPKTPPVDPSARVIEVRQSRSARDDAAIRAHFPSSWILERPPEAPVAQKEGGAFGLLYAVQFAPVADVRLAAGATHDVDLQIAAPSLLMGSAEWIGTPNPLALSVSLNGVGLANGAGFARGPDRGESVLTTRTAAGGLARLSVTNTSAATVDVRIVLGALNLNLEP